MTTTATPTIPAQRTIPRAAAHRRPVEGNAVLVADLAHLNAHGRRVEHARRCGCTPCARGLATSQARAGVTR